MFTNLRIFISSWIGRLIAIKTLESEAWSQTVWANLIFNFPEETWVYKVKLVVQESELERDRTVLIETLGQHLSESSTERRFDWLYTQNPYGRARTWLARNSENGEVVGASAAFRCRANVDGVERTGWVLGDFCVADKYRTLGPALQLQRATLAGIQETGESAFYYDFPSVKMLAIYERCKVLPAGRMMRLAKRLRLDHKHQQTRKSIEWMRPAIAVGNFVLRGLDARIRRNRKWSVALHEGSCDVEFTTFNERTGPGNSFETERSAEYLNWRYLKHPYLQYEILTVRDGDELQGYVIFSRDNKVASIAEWRVGNNSVLLKTLLWELIRRLRQTQTTTLSAYLRDTDPRLPILKSMGFWPRESCPVVVQWSGSPTNGANRLLLMHGDRES